MNHEAAGKRPSLNLLIWTWYWDHADKNFRWLACLNSDKKCSDALDQFLFPIEKGKNISLVHKILHKTCLLRGRWLWAERFTLWFPQKLGKARITHQVEDNTHLQRTNVWHDKSPQLWLTKSSDNSEIKFSCTCMTSPDLLSASYILPLWKKSTCRCCLAFPSHKLCFQYRA